MKSALGLMALAWILAGLLGLTSIAGVVLVLVAIWLVWEGWRFGFALLPVKMWRWARFMWHFLIDMTHSNLKLAWDVLTPKDLHRVRLILVPVEDLTPRERTLLSVRITLTPGTLACDLTEDRKHLLVHAMYHSAAEDQKELRRPIDILKGKETRA
jgi:multicomponent Na+:H+ antiporter subunit E